MTRRPLTSRVSLLAPLNIVSWAWRPTLSHNFPPGTTIWIAETHCQRLMVKKTRTDSDLGHISEVAAVSGGSSLFPINLLGDLGEIRCKEPIAAIFGETPRSRC